MTWQIFLGVVEVVAFVIAVGAIIAKASAITTALQVAIGELRETLKDFKLSSNATHKEHSEKLEEHGKTLADHEVRIHILEERRKEK